MTMRNLFSARELAARMKAAYDRFPATTVLLGITCLLWMLNIAAKYTDNIEAIIWAGTLASLSTLAIYLWCELLQNRKWLNTLVIIAISVSLADYFYITFNDNFGTNAEFLGRVALTTALVIGIFFPPVAKDATSKKIFRFSVEQFRSAVLTVALSIVLAIAVAIIIQTIAVLFHWRDDKLWQCMFVVFSAWIPTLFFLNMISDIRKDTPEGSNVTLGNATLFVLLPIAVVYTVILYIYGLKILLQWELPKDSISIMVAGLLCVVLVTIYGLQAFTLENSNDKKTKIALLVDRWLPAALLPLIVLMTIGLIYRINQYGFTISRIYLATFTLWAYATIIYMLIRQRKARLNSVAASFAVVFVAVSVFPYVNYSNLILSHIRQSIFADLGPLLYPVDLETMQDRLKELPEKEARDLASRIEYYYDYASKNQIAQLTDYKDYISTRKLLPDSDGNSYNHLYRMALNNPVEMPEGYKTVKTKNFSNYSWDKFEKQEDGTVIITQDSISLRINLDTLFHIIRKDQRALPVAASTPDDPYAVFIITDARLGTPNDSLQNISGYMFQH